MTGGLNDCQKDVTIAQSGAGPPDDSSQPIEAIDEEADSIRAKVEDDPRSSEKVQIDQHVESPLRD